MFWAASTSAKELSDLRQRGPPTRTAVRLVLHHRNTRSRITDQPPDIAIGALVENSRGHAFQQVRCTGVPGQRWGKNQFSDGTLSPRYQTLLIISEPTPSGPCAGLRGCLADEASADRGWTDLPPAYQGGRVRQFGWLRVHGRVIKMSERGKRVQSGVSPLSRTSISLTCWCQGAPEVSALLLVVDIRPLS